MEILRKPLKEITFEYVVDFCKEGQREDIQLDYKQILPGGGLSKHFASFSNARGGLIIVGVKEDRKTGVPRAWLGIKNEAKEVERIHQWASSVEPIPSYEVHVTNEIKGQVFILIRISEGDQTPYYVLNDSNIWVRTGNISNPINIASPDFTELLFNKRGEAHLARSTHINLSREVYANALERSDKERVGQIKSEKERLIEAGRDSNDHGYFNEKLGTNTCMLDVLIQPFYPRKSLTSPKEIKDNLINIRDVNPKFHLNFPSLEVEPIPEGVLHFSWGYRDGNIRSDQIYSKGLVFHSIDILRVGRHANKTVYVSHVLTILFEVTKFAGNFYNMFGYQGGLIGYLLIRGLKGISLNTGLGSYYLHDSKVALLDKYRLDIDIDTALLNDEKAWEDYFIDKAKELFWNLGFGEVSEKSIKSYLKEHGWLVE